MSETFRKRQQVRAAVEQDKPIREIIESIEFCWLSRFEARRCLLLALPMGVLIASAVQSAASPTATLSHFTRPVLDRKNLASAVTAHTLDAYLLFAVFLVAASPGVAATRPTCPRGWIS